MLSSIYTNPTVQELLNKCAADIEKETGLICIVHLSVKKAAINIEDLKEIIAQSCDVSWQEVAGPLQTRKLTIPRMLFCWYAMTFLRMRCTHIGQHINRDHSTVLRSRKEVGNLVSIKDPVLYPLFCMVEERIENLQRRYNEV